MLSILFYLLTFGISCFFMYFYQANACRKYRISGTNVSAKSFMIGALFCCLPAILVYGLRYGIGTDYFSYRNIYYTIKNSTFETYLTNHFNNNGMYYIEMGYAILNKLSPDYTFLCFLCGIIIYACVCIVLTRYRIEFNAAFGLYIFFCTQFTYSMNGVRFSIAILIVLIGFVCLIDKRTISFIICILLATCFHKTAILCFAYFFLQEFKSKKLNKARNFILVALIIIIPFFFEDVYNIFKQISFFSRFFSIERYSMEEMESGYTWLLHILPVLLPIVIFGNKNIKDNYMARMAFRLCMIEFLLRMLGLFNTYYTRFARFAQIGEIILIPLVLAKIESKSNKKVLTIYYVVWYTFYFIYYALVNDKGDTIPYESIF